MKHLKKFAQNDDYTSFKSSSNWTLPNVSLVYGIPNKKVYYSPKLKETPYRIICVFETTSANSNLYLVGGGDEKKLANISAMRIDGELIKKPVVSYVFETPGEHVVEYSFKTPDIETEFVFCGLKMTTAYINDNITSLSKGIFSNCSNLETVFIGKNCLDLNDYTFDQCNDIKNIVVRGQKLPTYGEYSFNIDKMITVNGKEDVYIYYYYKIKDTAILFNKPEWHVRDAIKPLTCDAFTVVDNTYTIYIGFFPDASLCATGTWQYILSYLPDETFYDTWSWHEDVMPPEGKESWDTEGSYVVVVKHLDKSVNIHVKVEERTCVVEGTLINVAGGKQKKVEDLTSEDMIVVWDFETGQLTTTPTIFIEKSSDAPKTITYLTFSNGEVIGVSLGECFYDYDLNKFVEIRHNNFNEFIGHTFMYHNGEEFIKTQLVNGVNKIENKKVYSVVTNKHFGRFTNNFLTAMGGVYGIVNVYPTNAQTMMINQEMFEQEKQTYGVFTYDEFCETCGYVPEPVFEAFNAQLYKILIGKNEIDVQYVKSLINYYEHFWN